MLLETEAVHQVSSEDRYVGIWAIVHERKSEHLLRKPRERPQISRQSISLGYLDLPQSFHEGKREDLEIMRQSES